MGFGEQTGKAEVMFEAVNNRRAGNVAVCFVAYYSSPDERDQRKQRGQKDRLTRVPAVDKVKLISIISKYVQIYNSRYVHEVSFRGNPLAKVRISSLQYTGIY